VLSGGVVGSSTEFGIGPLPDDIIGLPSPVIVRRSPSREHRPPLIVGNRIEDKRS